MKSIAIRTCLDINGCMMKDAARLRTEYDGIHIEARESAAVLKGINLALKWNLKVTD